MKESELISICMPVFNDSISIKKSILSILKQTYKNFEVIIIDNKSIDGTYEIIKKFNDPRIRLYRNNENIGWRLNSNKALSLARGKYVCTLHGDDLFKEHYIEFIKNIFDKYSNVGIIHCIRKGLKENYFEDKTIINSDEYYSMIASTRCMPAATQTAYRYESIKGSNYYDKNYWTGEARLSMEIARRGYDAYIHGEELCIRHIGAPNDSQSIYNKVFLCEHLLEFYQEYKDDTKIQDKDKKYLKERIMDNFNNLKELNLKYKDNEHINKMYEKTKKKYYFKL